MKYLVTAALPYANGPLHVGHIAGAYLPADIYVRYRKMKGDDVIFICGTDEHGVPITIRAMQENTSPREVVDKYHELIEGTFNKLGIIFDNFSGTAKEIHYKISQEFFLNLVKNGYTVVKDHEQFFCDTDKIFLPDRYIEGKCKHCGYEIAKGDQCEKCGKTLDPKDLIEPKCVLCGATPILKITKHWFFRLEMFEQKLREYLNSKNDWRSNVRDFALSWIRDGLKDRAISRDLNWGVPIPLEEADGKVMYVWFEAPIGYISSTIEWSHKIGQHDKWKEYWLDKDTKLIHFIGKDNIPFHAIIWPATLMAQHGNWILPDNIPANEFMNLEGEKISTSRNWAIWVHEFLEEFPADTLRYYLCSNMPETKDSNFYWKEFQIKVNEELANGFGNLVSRVLKFINSRNRGIIPKPDENAMTLLDKTVMKDIKEIISVIGEKIENFEFRQGIKYLRELAFLGNKYVDETKMWNIKDVNSAQFRNTVFVAANIVFIMALVMYPFMPFSAVKILNMMGYDENFIKSVRWDQIEKVVVEHGKKISADIQPIFTRIEDKVVEKYVLDLKKISKNYNFHIDSTDLIVDIKTFNKLDLRIAYVKAAERIKNSEKLLKLFIDIGSSEKEIVAGIGKYYAPEDIVGKNVVIINNLKPIEIFGHTSYGMLLAAYDSGGNLKVLTVDGDIEPGSKVS